MHFDTQSGLSDKSRQDYLSQQNWPQNYFPLTFDSLNLYNHIKGVPKKTSDSDFRQQAGKSKCPRFQNVFYRFHMKQMALYLKQIWGSDLTNETIFFFYLSIYFETLAVFQTNYNEYKKASRLRNYSLTSGEEDLSRVGNICLSIVYTSMYL